MGTAELQLNKDLISDGELTLIAQKLHDELSGRKASEEWQRSRASSLDPEVKRLLDVQNLDRESELYGAFAEVKPENEQDIDFARGYFDPIKTLAFAYSLPASDFYQSEKLAESMIIRQIAPAILPFPGIRKEFICLSMNRRGRIVC